MVNNTLDTGYILLLALIIICVFGLVSWFYYLDYKRKLVQKDKPPDPIVRSVVLSGFFLGMALIAEILGTLPKGWVAKYFWVFVCLGGAYLLLYWIVINKRKILSFETLKKLAKRVLMNHFKASKHRGAGFSKWFTWYKRFNIIEQDGTTTIAGAFLFQPNISGLPKNIMIVEDAVNGGDPIEINVDPPENLITRLQNQSFGVPKKGGFEDEFDQETEDITTKERTEVKVR